MTLVDFLLARIAEDTAKHGAACADCRARRQVVQFCRDKQSRNGAEDARLHDLLRTLAGTYAAHPDYDEAWRP